MCWIEEYATTASRVAVMSKGVRWVVGRSDQRMMARQYCQMVRPPHLDLLAPPRSGGDDAFKCLGLSLDFSSSKYHKIPYRRYCATTDRIVTSRVCVTWV